AVFDHRTRAAALFRPAAGIAARFLRLYPRGGAFPAGRGYFRAVFDPCTRAAACFRPAAGIFARFSTTVPARFLLLYPCAKKAAIPAAMHCPV
ncbi:MAG: hypothetical protein PUB17_01190, partial [Lachnospiraceae bacterium]|nr:hypothetical protein [Lachnospiraceae bacterium]